VPSKSRAAFAWSPRLVAARGRGLNREGARPISWFLVAVGALVASGLASWLLSLSGGARGPRLGVSIGAVGAVAGCAIGLVPALAILLGAPPETLHAAWSLPLASFALGIDPLSAFFLLPVFGLSGLAAWYGAGYLRPSGRREAASWLWFSLLVAGMAVVVAARNGMLFLVAWETMSLASYFLVALRHESEEARRAGRVYLIATHVGTAFLFVFFLALSGTAPSLDFERIGADGAATLLGAPALFLIAVAGFGTKAGLMPFHMWLPEAHPAAPAHVSAVMSGAMITMGIYGLVRMLPYVGAPPPWWGWVLIGLGLVSAILGVLYALAQHELKRLLAYSSIENVGIVACGLGLGLLGISHGVPFLAALGLAGALLHVLNHAAFKGLLFLAAGSVVHGAGTAEIETLGGLLRRMPWTGAAFLIGALAISGLPPLNGFVSEFLITLGSFRAVASAPGEVALAGTVVIAGLALSAGVAAATFVKSFGIAFLGEPRSERARGAHEASASMRLPMAVLAAACLALGIGAPWVFGIARSAVPYRALLPAAVEPELDAVTSILTRVAWVAGGFLLLVLAGAALRSRLLARRREASGTWDCGFAAPTPRMQYTASSFAQPILELVAPVLGTRVSSHEPAGLFPSSASHATAVTDTFRDRVLVPIAAEVQRRLAPFRKIQEGRVQVYVLYIAITLLAVLLYQFLVNP